MRSRALRTPKRTWCTQIACGFSCFIAMYILNVSSKYHLERSRGYKVAVREGNLVERGSVYNSQLG